MAAQDAEAPGRDLYLEVFVNGNPTNLITRFTDRGEGVLSADADELRNSGILPDAVANTGEVRLDEIPGLGWRLIEPEQTIRFIVPDTLLAPHVLSAEAPAVEQQDDEGPPPIDRGTGLVLNYGLNVERWRPLRGGTIQNVGASFDARLFMPWGALNHGFALTEAEGGGLQTRRLDTFWRSDFLDRSLQVQLGDIATRGPSWSRPVRLGGLMIQRNFGLRPDLVTLPLPAFEGSAALPSTVEVFSGTLRTYTADVPAGPFRISDLPLTGGSGRARVVVRDVTGRETQLDLPYLVSEDLLRPGMIDFALAAGRPRLGIGSNTDRYVDRTYGTATMRLGATEGLTLLAHAEGGAGLAMAGMGATVRLAQSGTVTLSYARSRAPEGEGSLVDVSGALNFGQARLTGRVTATRGAFADVAAVSADPDLADRTVGRFPRHLAQMSFSLPLQPDGLSSASLFLSDLHYADAKTETSFGASYSRQIGTDVGLTLSAIMQRGLQEDAIVAAQVHMPLGKRRDLGLYSERRRRGWRHDLTISGGSAGRVPGWDWRLQAARTDRTSLQGQVAAESTLGRLELAGRVSDDSRGLGLRADGALVVAGGDVFATRRIDDAFAVVDAGAPGVEVSAENRPVGRTGRSGKLLVPDLRAYESNAISIDPTNLPVDAAVASTRQIVRPAHRSGAKIDFGVKGSADEAVIALVDAQGLPLEVGGGVVLNGVDDGALLVGFDGEVFALGLQPQNELSVFYPDGRRCTATFPYAAEPGTLTEVRGVPCL